MQANGTAVPAGTATPTRTSTETGASTRSTKVWLSVAETARELGVSRATVYRLIADEEFPAIKVRGRLKVPSRTIDEIQTAAENGETIDLATWTQERRAAAASRSAEVVA